MPSEGSQAVSGCRLRLGDIRGTKMCAAVVAEEWFVHDLRYVPARMILGVEILTTCCPEGCDGPLPV